MSYWGSCTGERQALFVPLLAKAICSSGIRPSRPLKLLISEHTGMVPSRVHFKPEGRRAEAILAASKVKPNLASVWASWMRSVRLA